MKQITLAPSQFNIRVPKFRRGTAGFKTGRAHVKACMRRNEVYEEVEKRTQLFSVPLTRYELTADPTGAIKRIQTAIAILVENVEAGQ